MTVYPNKRDLFYCEIIATSEIVPFYILQNMNVTNGHSTLTRIAPFTATGFTQNLGRNEYNISGVIMLTSDTTSTMEQKYNKLLKVKNKNVPIKLVAPNLPDDTANNYHITQVDQELKEPSRLTISISLTEDMKSSLKANIQNLVGINAINNLRNVLTDRGYI